MTPAAACERFNRKKRFLRDLSGLANILLHCGHLANSVSSSKILYLNLYDKSNKNLCCCVIYVTDGELPIVCENNICGGFNDLSMGFALVLSFFGRGSGLFAIVGITMLQHHLI
jgi:hypothetical protein